MNAQKEERKKQELLAKFETASGSGKRLGEATSAQKSFKPGSCWKLSI